MEILNKHYEYICQTIGKEPDSVAPVAGGLTLVGKYKVSYDGRDWMVKVGPGNANRELWYKELNRRCDHHMANPKIVKYFDDGILCLVAPWITGESLETMLVDAMPSEVAEYGRQAAEILKKIHSEPLSLPVIGEKTVARINEDCRQVSNLGLTFPGYEICCAFLQEEARTHEFGEVSLLHRDIRPENFIVHDGQLVLIDFENGGIGEIAEDFAYLLTMGRIEHRPFSRALIEQYLQGTDGTKFWKDNLLYSTLQLVEYAIWKWNRKGRQVVHQAENLMKQYNGLTEVIPEWWKTL